MNFQKSYNFFPNFGNTLETPQTLDTFIRYDITMMQDGTERHLRICIIIMNNEGSLFAYIKGLAANSAQPLPGRPTTSRFAVVIPLSAAETFTYKPYNIRIPPEEGCQKFRIPDFLAALFNASLYRPLPPSPSEVFLILVSSRRLYPSQP